MGKNQYFSHVLTKRSQQYICFVFFCLALLGCAQQNEAPFPYDLNGYRVAKQDSLPELPWVTIGEPDSLGRVKFKTQPFFIDQLPKRRFNSIQTRAVADFNQVLIRDDRHYLVLQALAKVFAQAGAKRGALTLYERALAINPRLEGGGKALEKLRLAVDGQPL